MCARGAGVTTTALSRPIDVHMVTHERACQGGRRLLPASGLTVGRRIGGFAVAAAGLPLAANQAQPQEEDADSQGKGR